MSKCWESITNQAIRQIRVWFYAAHVYPLASEELGKSANSGPEVEHRLPTASALENQIHQEGVIVNRAIQSPQDIQAGVT